MLFIVFVWNCKDTHFFQFAKIILLKNTCFLLKTIVSVEKHSLCLFLSTICRIFLMALRMR